MTVKNPTEIPERLGRYRIVKLLGKGGMGAVYLAHDEDLGRDVALKVPQFTGDDDSRSLERFYQEARAAATFRHPNLCPVHEVGQIDGVHYLTMAYIEGKPLSEWLHARKALTLRQAAFLVRKLALALQEAHAHGVIHRDLKPANVMIDTRNEPIVMDFGLARRNQSGDARITQSGVIMGSPAYMAPEQARDVRTTGPACDVYSLGVILYELLTGRLPFTGDAMSVLSRVLLDEPPPPSRFRPDLDGDLEAICLKAMAKKVLDRFASMGELAEALLSYLRGENEAIELPMECVEPPREEESRPGESASRRALTITHRQAERTQVEEPARKHPPKRSRRSKQKRERIPWMWVGIGTAALGVLLLVGAVLLIRQFSRSPNPVEKVETVVHPLPPTPPPDPLPVPPADGFQRIFNGTDLSGWVREGGDNTVWKADRGAMTFTVADPKQRGWLLTEREHANFVLRFDFRLAAGANSGVGLRMAPLAKQALAVQIQDDSAPKWLKLHALAHQKTGALFNVGIDQPAQLVPAGGWNRMEISLRDWSLRIAVNGQATLDTSLTGSAVARQLGALPRPRGRIGLQSWEGSVSFRNVEVMELPGEPAPLPPLPVDLLARIDPKKDVIEGNWKVKQGIVISPIGKWPRLQIPYVPPEEYRIDMVVQRRDSKGFGIGLGFVAGGRQALLVLDGFVPTVSGLDTVDGKRANLNETTRPGALLPVGQRVKLSLTVRRTGVQLSCEGKTIFTWPGPATRLRLVPEWRIPNERHLFLVSQCVCSIHEMTLTPLAAPAQAPLIPGPGR